MHGCTGIMPLSHFCHTEPPRRLVAQSHPSLRLVTHHTSHYTASLSVPPRSTSTNTAGIWSMTRPGGGCTRPTYLCKYWANQNVMYHMIRVYCFYSRFLALLCSFSFSFSFFPTPHLCCSHACIPYVDDYISFAFVYVIPSIVLHYSLQTLLCHILTECGIRWRPFFCCRRQYYIKVTTVSGNRPGRCTLKRRQQIDVNRNTE
jgi:hypothetical protein